MSLNQFAHFNNLSEKLREELFNKVKSFGKSVRYSFDIAKKNPDPTKYNGDIIYPNMYTLDPARFTIQDPYETSAKSKTKNIALVDENSIDDKGVPQRFKKVKVRASDKAVLKLELEDNPEHFEMAMFLELHPKLTGGMFEGKNVFKVMKRIDEKAFANTERQERTERLKAMNAAQSMSPAELVDFADAMMWESSLDEVILRNMAEDLAEENPKYFNDMVEANTTKFLSVIKKCIDRGIIAFDHAEYKFIWVGNNQTIVVLQPVGEKTEREKFAEWLHTAGDKANDVFKKMQSLVKSEKATA